MRTIILCAALLASTTASATKITKCVDEAGKVTFSQHGCPQSSNADVLTVSNPKPSSDGKVVRMAPTASSGSTSSGATASGTQTRSTTPARRSCSRCRFR